MPRLPASELINRIEDGEFILADGAMGTELMRRGAALSETLNCNRLHPDWVKAIHHEYIEAGARLLYSNTFAPPKSREEYTDVLAGWRLLNEACQETDEKVWAAISLYPTTIIEHPELMDQIFALENAPDLVVIETCCSLDEAKTAVWKIHEYTTARIFVTATFNQKQQMHDKTPLKQWIRTWQNHPGISAFGANCDGCLFRAGEILSGMWRSRKPVLFRPSSGFTDDQVGYVKYNAQVWAEIFGYMLESHEQTNSGLRIVGGCCGTTPEYIRELVQTLSHKRGGMNSPL